MLPSFPTIQILPFSLYHLSHTEVRMDMGHNRASVFLSCSIYSSIMRNQQRNWHGACCHTYTPMKVFLGHMACLQGAIWLLWLCGTKTTDLDLFSSEAYHECTLITHPHWNWITFCSISSGYSSPCNCLAVSDRWLDCQTAAKKISQRMSWENYWDVLWDLNCHNCPASLWDTLSMQFHL